MSVHSAVSGCGEATASHPAFGPAARRDWRPALVAMGLALAVVLVAYRAAITEIGRIIATNQTYMYIWAVVPTVALMVWWHRHSIAAIRPCGSPWGVGLALGAAAVWLAGELIAVAEARHAATVMGVVALVWSTLGTAGFRRVLPVCALLAFAVPTGEVLVEPLREAAVWMLYGVASVLGLEFAREGFAVFVAGERYVVIRDCSGLPYVLLGAFLGTTFGALTFHRLWKVLGFAAAGALLGVLANGVRLGGIIAADAIRGVQMDVSEHDIFELPAVAALLVALLLLLARARKDAPLPAMPEPRRPAAARMHAVTWPLLAAAVLVAPPMTQSAVGGAGPARIPALPAGIGPWTKAAAIEATWSPAAHAADSDVRAAYVHTDTGRRVEVFVAQAWQRTAKVSAGGVDLVGSRAADGETWLPSGATSVEACAGGRCLSVRAERVVLTDSQRVRHILWTYAVGQDTTVAPIALRAHRAWTSLRGAPRPARVIALMTETSSPDAFGLPSADAARLLHGLITAGSGTPAYKP